MRLFFDDEESFKDVLGSLRFDNLLGQSSIGRVGSLSTTPPQERSEDMDIIAA
jgi:hypothetical protein